MTLHRLSCLVLPLVVLAAAAPRATGQTPGTAAPPPILERLGADDYAVREAATAELLRDERADAATLAALFVHATTPEQRHRLLDAIRHHTIRRYREADFPREGDPAIGFSHDIRRTAGAGGHHNGAGAAVFVVTTLPGFPGHAYLRPGDLITAIDNEPLPAELDNDLFKARLRRHEAGDRIRLTVVRDGREVSIEIRLATIESLERLYTQSPTLQEPYHSRWQQTRDALLAQAPAVPTLTVPAAP